MSVLSAKARRKLPTSAFAGRDRTFPVNDKVHAEKAIELAPRSEHAGNISRATEQAIVRRAKARLKRLRRRGLVSDKVAEAHKM